MEFLKGSVKDEINRKQELSEKEAMHYFMQAAEGLVYLHDMRPKAIIHRDIKCILASYLLNFRDITTSSEFS